MYKHIIPTNISDNGNIGNGFLKKRNTVEAITILIIMFIVFKYALFAVPFFLKTILFVTFALFPAIIALIGIGDESLLEALITYRAYSKTKDIIPYSLAAYGEEEKEPESRKERKQRKKEEKERKKEDKAAEKARKKGEKKKPPKPKKEKKKKEKKKKK